MARSMNLSRAVSGAALAALLVGCGGAAPVAAPANAAVNASGKPVQSATNAPAAKASEAAKAKPAEGEAEASKPVVVAVEKKAPLLGAARETFASASAAFADGRLADAKAGFEKASRESTQSAAPLVGVGAVLERQGDVPAALEVYRKAAQVDADDPDAARAFVLALLASGRAPEAVSVARARAEKYAKSPAAATLLSEAASGAGDSATAQAEAQRALALDSSYVPAMLAVARDHYRAGRVSMTAYALKALLDGIDETTPARAKDCAEALLLRAVIDRRTPGRRAAALEGFARVHQLRPDLTEASLALGVMKLEAGNAEEAIASLDVAAKFAPKNAFVATALGDAYRLAGRYAEAKAMLEKAVALDGSLAAPHYNLALLFLYAGDKAGLGNEERFTAAQREMEAYVGIRGPKAPPGVDDDADSLLATAKQKLAEVTSK
jgi:tetratricopeptide (TPR) repeat protein